MTGMLASVSSVDEALNVLQAGVDIIDLKQPANGALGALDCWLVADIVTEIAGLRPVSATIGDLPVLPDIIYKAVAGMSSTGVDFIKIGFFPGGDWPATITGLDTFTKQGLQLIAVLFADTQPDFSIINLLKDGGFSGVMLDTRNKARGSLTSVMTHTEIAQFIALAKSKQLLCGLAGSLSTSDVPALLAMQPDYLGFRSALCKKNQRTASLDETAINKLRTCFSVLPAFPGQTESQPG